jgi:hypothetical protein
VVRVLIVALVALVALVTSSTESWTSEEFYVVESKVHGAWFDGVFELRLDDTLDTPGACSFTKGSPGNVRLTQRTLMDGQEEAIQYKLPIWVKIVGDDYQICIPYAEQNFTFERNVGTKELTMKSTTHLLREATGTWTTEDKIVRPRGK